VAIILYAMPSNHLPMEMADEWCSRPSASILQVGSIAQSGMLRFHAGAAKQIGIASYRALFSWENADASFDPLVQSSILTAMIDSERRYFCSLVATVDLNDAVEAVGWVRASFIALGADTALSFAIANSLVDEA